MSEKNPPIVPPRGNWIWNALRKKKRGELDKAERSLVVGRFVRREFAGDPSQAEEVQIPLKQPKKGS